MQAVETDKGQLEVSSHSPVNYYIYQKAGITGRFYKNYYELTDAKTETCYRRETELSEFRTDAIGSCNGPEQSHAKYPQYADYNKRFVSFSGWTSQFAHQSPRNMATEGFFFLGTMDRVRCFYCGITLRDWEEDDDPYEAHLEWSENCAFIKGRRQERIKRQRAALLASTASSNEPGTSAQSRTTAVTELTRSATTANEPSTSVTTASEQEAGACSAPTSQMHSSKIEAVLEMGYSLDVIERAIEIRQQSGRGEFVNAMELFEAVLDLE